MSRSVVWKYFELNDDKTKTKCTLCKASLSFGGGSTSAMRNHLKMVHSTIFGQLMSTGKPQSCGTPNSLSTSRQTALQEFHQSRRTLTKTR